MASLAVLLHGPAASPDRKRPFLPRDLASCPACRRLVVLRRDREGPGFGLATPTRRLAVQARRIMKAAGLFPFVADCPGGKGKKAGRPHFRDCCTLPLFRPFAEPRRKGKKRGGR